MRMARWDTRSVSSAYLSNRLMRFWGCRSEASITKEQGPITEPCTMLAEMKAIAERMPLNLVWWQRSDRKLTTQLYTLSGMGKFENFSIMVEWRTVSKALEKSKAMRCTKGFVNNISEMRCRRHMIIMIAALYWGQQRMSLTSYLGRHTQDSNYIHHIQREYW